jgi:hypothetical protein
MVSSLLRNYIEQTDKKKRQNTCQIAELERKLELIMSGKENAQIFKEKCVHQTLMKENKKIT